MTLLCLSSCNQVIFIPSVADTSSDVIGLYRDVWIAAIASSTTSLATRTAAMCVRFQGRRVRHNADYVPYAKIRFDL